MTVVQLVPLLLYFLYRTALQAGGRGKDNGLPDRGRRRGLCPVHRQRVHRPLVQPLPRVLRRPVRRQRDGQPGRARLGPGQDRLRPGGAGQRRRLRRRPKAEGKDKKGKKKKKAAGVRPRRHRRHGNLRPQGRPWRWSRARRRSGFDRSGSGTGTATIAPSISKENLKSAMQWDLWNPWATFYELNSTHPLIAHRLQYLERPGRGDGPGAVHRLRPPQARVVLG